MIPHVWRTGLGTRQSAPGQSLLPSFMAVKSFLVLKCGTSGCLDQSSRFRKFFSIANCITSNSTD